MNPKVKVNAKGGAVLIAGMAGCALMTDGIAEGKNEAAESALADPAAESTDDEAAEE